MSNLTSYTVPDLRIPPGKETDFHPNWYRDAYLGLKSALLILVLVLSLKVHRDFLKLLAFFLLLPIIVDISFDIYCEVHSNVDPQPRSSISWLWGLDYASFFNENFGPQPLYAFYRINSRFYQFLVYVYTGYEVYRFTWWWSLASFGIGVFLFWSTLVYSMVALHLSHRAILRPHLLVEGPSPLRGYVNGLLLPTLFTIAEVLIQFRVDAIPPLIYFVVISIERISLLLLALSLLLQLFASLFILCVREREYTKTCPYDEVSEARSRLVWLLVFVLLLNLLNVPAVVHASLSLAEDVRLLFSLGALPSGYRDVALFAFAYHGVAFFVRPAVILVLSLLFLVPYRRALVRSLCCQADY